MKLRRETADRLFLAAGLASVLASLLTLVPNPFSMTLNVFGYRSICSFVPMSTAACLVVADVVFVVQSRFSGSRRAGAAVTLGPVVVAAILVVLAAFSFPVWKRERVDLSSRMQSEIPESEYGYKRAGLPEDPDFPPPKPSSPPTDGDVEENAPVEWIGED